MSPVRSSPPTVRAALLAAALALSCAPGAAAAPPANDAPAGAAPFEPYTAANGRPRQLQAIADLAEATGDRGVPRCLGSSSFSRTAWYRIPAAPFAQEIAVDATGRTLEVVDLAAFVQPLGADVPVTSIANACAGEGAGGSDAAEESTAGVALRVGAGHDVLIQVARRGAAGHPENERALLSLDARELPVRFPPEGDGAGLATPIASASRASFVSLEGATVGEEDPATPPCPSLGTVWRRFVPGADGARRISVEGRGASTLAVFAGERPTASNARDCVVRAGYGALHMRVPMQRRRPVWIRIGVDQQYPTGALLRIGGKNPEPVVDGGPGGFDPTPGGAGGGLPAACERAQARLARVRGPQIGGTLARSDGRRTLPLVVTVRGSAICDAQLELVGPGGGVYATARFARLSGRRVVRLTRLRRIAAGRYRLRVEAASELGGRTMVRSSIRGRR